MDCRFTSASIDTWYGTWDCHFTLATSFKELRMCRFTWQSVLSCSKPVVSRAELGGCDTTVSETGRRISPRCLAQKHCPKYMCRRSTFVLLLCEQVVRISYNLVRRGSPRHIYGVFVISFVNKIISNSLIFCSLAFLVPIPISFRLKTEQGPLFLPLFFVCNSYTLTATRPRRF